MIWFLDFRFNALKMLHMLRDKRIMFIGDSLQRGQFESMICLIQSVIPEGKKSLQRIPPMKIFKIEVHESMSIIYLNTKLINNITISYSIWKFTWWNWSKFKNSFLRNLVGHMNSWKWENLTLEPRNHDCGSYSVLSDSSVLGVQELMMSRSVNCRDQ